MCPPVIIGLIGTAVSAAGSIAAGQAQRAQADAQAEAYRLQADQTARQGMYQADRQKEQVNQQIGQQTAQIAGSGVSFSGSPSDVIGSTASSGQLDHDAILYGAKVNSNNLQYQAKLSEISGKNAATGGYLSAAGSVFGGLGNIGKMWDPNKTFMGNAFGMGY